jgi:hypothetical protein
MASRDELQEVTDLAFLVSGDASLELGLRLAPPGQLPRRDYEVN